MEVAAPTSLQTRVRYKNPHAGIRSAPFFKYFQSQARRLFCRSPACVIGTEQGTDPKRPQVGKTHRTDTVLSEPTQCSQNRHSALRTDTALSE